MTKLAEWPYTLDHWLNYISRQHPSEIEMGLGRVQCVFERLEIQHRFPPAVLVSGTNGKGSTIAAMEAGLSAVGVKVGVYSSPHISLFNERLRLCGKDVDDQSLIDAFVCVERARGDLALTYFEFTTLAVFVILAQQAEAGLIDIALCEIGLGGRLDAVNVLDPILSIVVSIGLDHQEWLGSDLFTIAKEKAGIFRKGSIGLVGETFPEELIDDLKTQGYPLKRISEDFGKGPPDLNTSFEFRGENLALDCVAQCSLPENNLVLAMQACLLLLEKNFAAVSSDKQQGAEQVMQIAEAISNTTVPGRFEMLSQQPPTIIDVGHNIQAVKYLSNRVGRMYPGKAVYAVFSCLKDKDIHAIVETIMPSITGWFVAQLNCERALELSDIEKSLQTTGANVNACASIEHAMERAVAEASANHGVVLAFGSFYVIEAIKARGLNNE